ncbi:MAG: hypothetical protein FJ087_21135, partial [Deltaproteobacteria bacterium]|nr:hypothetical protein [Deltaproteobacteria bacterium]
GQGKECGDDGCGAKCGACGQGEKCVVDQCVFGCGGVTTKGCCYKGDLVKCSYDGKLGFGPCDKGECGWHALGSYGCNTGGTPDPSGTYPIECNFTCAPKCDGRECGDDKCGGTCGNCSAGQVCNGGTCCTPGCEGKECGPDGCGGTCGAGCGEGFWCTDVHKCAYGYGCEQTTSAGCGGCACEKCVCDRDPYCCSDGWDWKCSYTCQYECGGCLPCQGEDCSALPEPAGPPDSPDVQDAQDATEIPDVAEVVPEATEVSEEAEPIDGPISDVDASSDHAGGEDWEDAAAASDSIEGGIQPDGAEVGPESPWSGAGGGCGADARSGGNARPWMAIAAMCFLALRGGRRGFAWR